MRKAKQAIRGRVGPLGLSLAAAALTVVALAAVSVAKPGHDESDRVEPGAAHGPGGPPMIHELSAADRKALESFRSCMEDQGVEPPPRPDGDGGGPDGGPDAFEKRLEPPSESEREQMQKAFEACRDELPEGVRHFGPGPGGPCGPPPGVRPGFGS